MNHLLGPALLAALLSWAGLANPSSAVPARLGAVAGPARAQLDAAAEAPPQVAEAGTQPELGARSDGGASQAPTTADGRSGRSTTALVRRGAIEAALSFASHDHLPLYFGSLPPPR